MKTEFEKMPSRELYCYFDPEIDRSIRHADEACFRFNRTCMEDPDYRPALEEMILMFTLFALLGTTACNKEPISTTDETDVTSTDEKVPDHGAQLVSPPRRHHLL